MKEVSENPVLSRNDPSAYSAKNCSYLFSRLLSIHASTLKSGELTRPSLTEYFFGLQLLS